MGNNGRKKSLAYTLGGVLLLLLIWQLLSLYGGSRFLLPSPRAVFARFFYLFAEKEAWIAVVQSGERILQSVFASALAAVLFAFAAWRSRAVRFLIEPIVLVMKTVPVVSFILIALFFLGERLLTPFVCSLVVFPMMYQQQLAGLLAVDPGLLEMARVFSLKKRDILRFIIVPSCTCSGAFLASFGVAVGMAWKAGVATEVLSLAKSTIGWNLYDAKLYLDMELLLAWTFAIVLASFVSERGLAFVLRHALSLIGRKLPERGCRPGKSVKEQNPPDRCGAGRPDDRASDPSGRILDPVDRLFPAAETVHADWPSLAAGTAPAGLSSPAAEFVPADQPFPAAETSPAAEAAPAGVISVRHLCKSFDGTVIFRDFSAELSLSGGPIVINGSSGVGKTTFLRLLAGLDRPESGDISGVPSKGIFVFQENRLIPQLSARDNIRVVLPDYDGRRADELLGMFDLTSVKNQQAGTLSGGEKRRLSMARALAPDSDILYLDEALRELDGLHLDQAVGILRAVSQRKPLILAAHDERLADRLNAHVLTLAMDASRGCELPC